MGRTTGEFNEPGEELMGAAPLSFGNCPHCGAQLKDRNACYACKRRVERVSAVEDGFFKGGFRKTVQRVAALNMKTSFDEQKGMDPKPIMVGVAMVLVLAVGGFIAYKMTQRTDVLTPAAESALPPVGAPVAETKGLSVSDKESIGVYARQVTTQILDKSAGEQVCGVCIDDCFVGEKNDHDLIPCNLQGVVTSYTKKNRKSACTNPFEMKMLIAIVKDQPKVETFDIKQAPVGKQSEKKR